MAYESEFTKSLTAKKTTSGYESEFTKQLTSGTYQSVKIPTYKKKKTFLQKAVSTGKNLVNMVSSDIKNAVSNNYDAFTKNEEAKRTNKTTTSTGSGGNRMVANTLDDLYYAKNSMEKKLSNPTISEKEKKQLIPIYNQTQKDIKAKESKGEKKTPTGKLIGKTAVSAATEFSKGVPSALEKVVDTTLNVATSKYNPYYWFNKDELASSQKIAEDLIKEDMTQNFLNVFGYGDKLSTGKTVQETLDTNSGLKSGSKEAQLLQGIGENVTTAFLGGLATGGMTGTSKASKVAKEIVESIPFGVTAYGGSLKEAYKGGADRQTANQYAALNTALELGTEKLYTAAGSILRTGGAVDDVLTKKITSKITNNLMQKLTKIGIGAVAEGGEEIISEAINPLLKQMTYMSDTDLKTLYNNADFLNAFVGGAIGGLVLGSAGVALDNNTATDIVNQATSQIENIANNSKNTNEVKLAKKLIENPNFGIQTATDQITQIANEIQNTNIPLKNEITTPTQINAQDNINVPTTPQTTQDVAKIQPQGQVVDTQPQTKESYGLNTKNPIIDSLLKKKTRTESVDDYDFKVADIPNGTNYVGKVKDIITDPKLLSLIDENTKNVDIVFIRDNRFSKFDKGRLSTAEEANKNFPDGKTGRPINVDLNNEFKNKPIIIMNADAFQDGTQLFDDLVHEIQHAQRSLKGRDIYGGNEIYNESKVEKSANNFSSYVINERDKRLSQQSTITPQDTTQEVAKTTPQNNMFYHGTAKGNVFDAYDINKAETGVGTNILNQGDRFYLTDDKGIAQIFGDMANQTSNLKKNNFSNLTEKGDVLQFKLKDNPKIKTIDYDLVKNKDIAEKTLEEAKQEGYDAIKFEDKIWSTWDGTGAEYVYNYIQKNNHLPYTIIPVENKATRVTEQTNLPSMIEQGRLSQSELDELNTLKNINEVMELTNEEQKRYDVLINKQKNEQNIIEKLKAKKQNDVVNKYNKTINSNVREITKKLNNVLAFDNIKQKDKFKKVLMDYASNNKKPTYDNIKKDIEDNFAEKIISTTDETLKNIKRDVRQYKIKVDDYLKRSITDYNNFKKSNFGKLVLSNEGQNINSVYDELSDRYPYVFDKDVINEVDQLNRLSDFMNEDITNVEKYNLSDDAVNEATGYIKAFLDNKKDLNELINNIEISSAEVRRESIKENRYLAQKYIQETSKWKDTPILKQRIQTMKRNLRDIVGSQSEEMYNEYFAPISQHNAESNKFINSYNERIKKLELNTNEAIATQMVGELKYNPDTQLKDSDLQDFIKSKNINIEKVNNAVETFRTIYDELIININDTLRQYGLKEIDYRKGYFPHFIDQHGKTIIGKIAEKLGWKFNDGKLPTDIAGLTEMFSPNKKWTPFAQRRTGDLTEYNALKGFDNYIRGASNLIHHTGDIQKLNGLQNEIRYQHSDKGLQKDIDEIEGSKNLTEEEKQNIIDTRFENYNGDLANFVTNLKDYTDNLAGKKSSLDRGAESLTGRKIYNTIDNIMGRVSANMVGANLSSAITNFIPLTQAYSQISTPNMFKAMAQTISNQKRSDNFVNRSVYLTNRINETDKLYKTGLEKITDKAGILFKVVDNFTAETIVRGKYLDNIKKGMTEQKAMNNADEFAKDVMAGRNLGDKPTLFNAKTNKLLTAFQLEVNNQYQYMFKDLPNDMKQEGTAKLILAFLKMFVGAWAYNQLAEKVTGRKSAFSPIDIITETIDTVSNDNLDVYDKVGKVGKNLLDELPFLGGLLGGGRIPISAAFPEGAKVIESVSNLFDATKEESTKRTSAKTLASELSKPLYYLVPPFGGGQTKKIIEGISMYTKDVPGSYTASGKLRFPVDKKVLQVAQSVLFGQYASDNAKEYFKNGYAPLGEKQIQEYKDLGVDIKDYWEYRAGLSKQKSVEDKFNYISGTNFTNEQKNILINNAVDRKESVDISNYKDYGSYDEFSYATDNPSDYKVSKQIASYDNYKKWSDEINFRKGLTSEDKKATIKYINSLPLTISQKALFIKKYYSSYDAYNSDIVKYVNSKNISKFDKATILKSVGFKNYDDYLINYVNGEKLTKEEKLNKLKDMGFTIKNGKVYK